MRRIIMAVVLASLAVGLGRSVIACRQDEPAGDPKTPANSPLPKIDKQDEEPKTGPKLPSLGDAG